MRFLLLPILLGALALGACKGSRTANNTTPPNTGTPADTATAQRGPNRGPNMNARPDTLVWLRAGGCHGTCPIYQFVVYVDGHVHYNGTRFTDLIGKYRKELNATQLDQIRQILREANLAQFNPQYGESGNDFPSQYIIAKLDGRRTAIDVYHNAPPAFDSLFTRLRDAVGIKEGYELVGE